MALDAYREAGDVAQWLGVDLAIAVLPFLMVALALFFVIKGINKVKKAEATAEPPTSEVLLGEIRDLLKN